MHNINIAQVMSNQHIGGKSLHCRVCRCEFLGSVIAKSPIATRATKAMNINFYSRNSAQSCAQLDNMNTSTAIDGRWPLFSDYSNAQLAHRRTPLLAIIVQLKLI
jgi:hypothetical protein